jgi:hypothetical protein
MFFSLKCETYLNNMTYNTRRATNPHYLLITRWQLGCAWKFFQVFLCVNQIVPNMIMLAFPKYING